MKNSIRLIALVCLVFISFSTLCSCSNKEAHGLGDYRYLSLTEISHNSAWESDQFDEIAELIHLYDYLSADYYCSYNDSLLPHNILERSLYYFEYTEQNYQGAKDYCQNNIRYIGDEITEEYNGYKFYDYYGNRSKETYHHCDNFPKAFKRVAFNDEKKTIVFLGVYTSGKRTDEMAEDVKDWGTFLNKYFSDYYRFE